MSQPAVNQTEIDGALGVLPPSSGKLLAVIGPSSSGSFDTPATYARVTDLSSAFGVGPMVEAAARHIEITGDPVVVVRCHQTTDGAMGTIDDTNVAGTAKTFITHTSGTKPLDDYEVKILIVAGGTTGVTGITYRYSLDNGRTYSPVQALGTSLTLAISNSGVSFDITTGKTLIAGDNWIVRTTAPAPNASELGTAFDALTASVVAWEIVELATPIDATQFDEIETKMAALPAAGKYRAWVGNTRIPNVAESESTYLSALTTIFSAKSTKVGELCAGSCQVVSSVSGYLYQRPISYVIASLEANVSEEIDIADINLGALVGVSIRDSNGNPLYHDESANPGLDDARFTTLRTWEGIAGVYVNRPRIFSAEGSDFQLMPHRRVMNLARATSRAYLLRRLNQPVLVDAKTGFILEEEALTIEAGLRAALRAVLLTTPKASGIRVTLSRTDNVLSTKTLTVAVRVIPLGYVEFITESVGFMNPALQVVAA